MRGELCAIYVIFFEIISTTSTGTVVHCDKLYCARCNVMCSASGNCSRKKYRANVSRIVSTS